jgi:PAS domain S-box-containing protein
VFEHNPAMYFMVDPTGTVLSLNTFGASQLGCAVDEWVGQSVLNLVFDENDKELVWKNIAVCVETLGQSHRWDAQKIRQDGTVLWTRENASTLRWSDNQVIVLIACEDITERYRDELELARLAAIISSSDDAIVSKTLDGKITSWNAGATTIFGYEAREMIGQPITHIIPPELHEDETQILTRLQRGERIRHYETVRVAKDGRRVDVSLTVSPLFDKSGKVVGASKVARDITAAKRAEAELQQTRTELARVSRVTTLGELTAAIAHEVNQPLTGLVSSANACLRWLAAETPDLDAARRSIERMIKDTNRSGEIINRIRTMVKKAPPQRDSLNINNTIMEVMALALTEVRRNSVSAHAELSDDLPPVLGEIAAGDSQPHHERHRSDEWSRPNAAKVVDFLRARRTKSCARGGV